MWTEFLCGVVFTVDDLVEEEEANMRNGRERGRQLARPLFHLKGSKRSLPHKYQGQCCNTSFNRFQSKLSFTANHNKPTLSPVE